MVSFLLTTYGDCVVKRCVVCEAKSPYFDTDCRFRAGYTLCSQRWARKAQETVEDGLGD